MAALRKQTNKMEVMLQRFKAHNVFCTQSIEFAQALQCSKNIVIWYTVQGMSEVSWYPKMH